MMLHCLELYALLHIYYSFTEISGPSSCFCSVISQYIHCFYWATLTLSVINDNLEAPIKTYEHAFTSVNYLFGVFVVAIIIGEVS